MSFELKVPHPHGSSPKIPLQASAEVKAACKKHAWRHHRLRAVFPRLYWSYKDINTSRRATPLERRALSLSRDERRARRHRQALRVIFEHSHGLVAVEESSYRQTLGLAKWWPGKVILQAQRAGKIDRMDSPKNHTMYQKTYVSRDEMLRHRRRKADAGQKRLAAVGRGASTF